MNKNIIIGVVIIILVIGGIYLFMQSQKGTTSSIAPTSVTTSNIIIQNFSFSQPSITIKKGETVVWTNKDSTGHTITGNNNDLSSPTLSTDQTYSFTFNNVGTFSYHCSIHPSMTGTVIVTE